MKIKKSKMLLATIILSIIQIAFGIFSALAIGLNLFGLAEYVDMVLFELYGGIMDLNAFLMSYYLDVAFMCLINFMAIRFYIKGYKYTVYNPQYGKFMILNAISQLLFSSFIPGLFALITGLRMMKKKKVQTTYASSEESYINEIKFEAMSQAITRLKELRANGAISEEEYYANLNKILES